MIGQGQRWRLLGKDLQVQRTRNWIRRASILTEPREASAEYHGGDHESSRGMLAPNESSQPVQEGFMDRRLTPEPNLSPYRILQIGWKRGNGLVRVASQQFIEITFVHKRYNETLSSFPS
jgi:hypothetical protein